MDCIIWLNKSPLPNMYFNKSSKSISIKFIGELPLPPVCNLCVIILLYFLDLCFNLCFNLYLVLYFFVFFLEFLFLVCFLLYLLDLDCIL